MDNARHPRPVSPCPCELCAISVWRIPTKPLIIMLLLVVPAVAGCRAVPIAQPTVPVPKQGKSKSMNKGGLYVTGEDHGKRLAADREAAKQKEAAAAAKQTSAWDKHRATVQAAEALLLAKSGRLEDVLRSTRGAGHLKMLVLSRTGHHAKKPNKPEEGQTESALLLEARDACKAQPQSLCPPQAEVARIAFNGSGETDDEGEEGEEGEGEE
jgi:hypothetical protein